jgi:mono/diheme cytochrome c family protein
MNQFARYSCAVLLLFAADRAQLANAQESKVSGDAERGKYIVENVAMCGRCHTPLNAAGMTDYDRRLAGAPILQPVPGWAQYAPRIAGQPPGTDDQFVRLLTTGITRTGHPPRQPMPQFHMSKADAEAVLAYLKSLRR